MIALLKIDEKEEETPSDKMNGTKVETSTSATQTDQQSTSLDVAIQNVPTTKVSLHPAIIVIQ